MAIPILQVGMPWFDPIALIVRNDNKLRSFYFYLSLVIMTGLLYYMDEVKIK